MTAFAPQRTWPALTGLRAIAAWIVFLHHYNPFVPGSPPFRIFNELHVGVGLFFVLSGFLIAYRYGDLSYRAGFTSEVRAFLRRRVARTFPLYLLLTAASFAFATWVLNAPFRLGSFIAHMTFIRGYIRSVALTGIPQGWSLTVEESFYLVAPLLFAFARLRVGRWLLIVAAAAIVPALAYFVEGWGTVRFIANYTLFGRIFEFAVGAYAGLRLRQAEVRPRLGNSPLWGTIAAGIIVYALGRLYDPNRFDYGIYHPVGIFLNNCVLPFATVQIILGLVSRPNGWAARALGNRWMVLFGQSSYAFYLVHFGVLTEWYLKALGATGRIEAWVAVQALSIALWWGVEEPLRGWILGSGRNQE